MAIVKIFFASGETTLTPDDIVTLEAFAAFLKKDPPSKIIITGNADSVGTPGGNLVVSKNRADAVKKFLVDQGIVAGTMLVIPKGDTAPLAGNDTPEQRAQNRRVDIVTPGSANDFPVSPSLGDAGEPAAPPPLEAAQGEVPLTANDVGTGALHPFVGSAGILAPPRVGNDVQFFVDGKDYMADVELKIRAANRFIFITDWSINPFVHLTRNSAPLQASDRLLDLLSTAVARGVDVRVLIWDSNKGFSNNRDREAETALVAAKVKVFRHDPDPGRTDSFAHRFSHHQKTIVMDSGDNLIAYVGGLDITSGRWDTPQHSVVADPNLWVDSSSTGFDGTPYYTGDFYNSDAQPPQALFVGMVPQRKVFPRLPWHDVHCRIKGPSALDVQQNFVQRWNFQTPDPKTALPAPGAPPANAGNMVVQIVRSAARKSIGPSAPATPETGILQAYINAIRLSQHHVYIENQFFTSNFEGDSPIGNRVMIELAERIDRAIKDKQKFRVKIVIPVHPEGDMDSLGTQELLHWEYRTIVRPRGTRSDRNVIAPLSFVGRVLKSLGGTQEEALKRLPEFLGFYNLRNHGVLSDGATVTTQVYVHTKMMLVDDRVAIIGSANINDRSLIGSRDTELAAIIVDNATKLVAFDGKNRNVRNFAHDLRLKLWQEHLGLTSPSDILDPIADKTHNLWHDTAKQNTAIYEAVFPNIASDAHVDLKAQKAASAFVAANAGRLSGVKGHLTLFPLDWLRNEDLETSGLSDDIFTLLEKEADDTIVA